MEHPFNRAVEAAHVAHTATEVAASKTALGATLTGSAAVVYGGYTLQEWVMLLGAATAVMGLVFQAYSTFDSRRARRRQEARDEEWHQARMASWRQTCNPEEPTP
jgi:hypothetical protein